MRHFANDVLLDSLPTLPSVCFDRKQPYARGHERHDGPLPQVQYALQLLVVMLGSAAIRIMELH